MRALIKQCETPAEALELCYWSKEPGLLEIVRGIAMMTEETRAAIEAFVVLSGDVESIAATFDQRGVLTLSSREAARAVAIAQHIEPDAAASEARVLN